MVYKVQGNFSEEKFEKIVNKLSEKFEFIYLNNTLFIALRNYSLRDNHRQFIDKLFRPVREFLITEITEKNIMMEHPVIVEWCRSNLVKLESQRFETEQQSKLQQVWSAMDDMEAELNNKLQEHKIEQRKLSKNKQENKIKERRENT